MNYELAYSIASKLVSLLRPACTRIEIAGSIRRLKANPGDIEIVAIPDLAQRPRLQFGLPPFPTQLDALLYSLCKEDEDGLKLYRRLGGDKYKKYFVSLDGGGTFIINLDLFLVTPPSDWGVEFLIRTGPRDFSQWLVSSKFIGGGLPVGYRCDGNRILRHDGMYIPCPEESDLLRFCGLKWIEPCDRHPMWIHPTRKFNSQPAKI
jgi:DNA polymerase/3'-5' exonuclease PolX